MNKERNYLRVKSVAFKHATKNGNPSWRVELEDEQGNTYGATTAPNSSAGLWFSRSSVNREALFAYHYTEGGKMRLDYIEPNYLALAWINGGWRERYAMRYGKAVEIGGGFVKYILSKRDPIQAANGATYDTKRGAWVH